MKKRPCRCRLAAEKPQVVGESEKSASFILTVFAHLRLCEPKGLGGRQRTAPARAFSDGVLVIGMVTYEFDLADEAQGGC
jgi:hypothetical protein